MYTSWFEKIRETILYNRVSFSRICTHCAHMSLFEKIRRQYCIIEFLSLEFAHTLHVQAGLKREETILFNRVSFSRICTHCTHMSWFEKIGDNIVY